MSALYFKDWRGHEHELLQRESGEFYYYNTVLGFDTPLAFYNSDFTPITNLADVEKMPHITRRNDDGT